ncbi:hypothetical protein BDU57DRAFT_596475 [Ampelomyces quisqualis]|uniref:Uncharacterized protein n=1 Tax=Ampelomyces quisqualis TaxID=50730 RepID=A0A6A5QI60_AMPQU|nr:hypothetical protein BDU57DRAFT_596475 [Ampelomyces quisqualis]
MAEPTRYKAPNPAPMYVLLVFSICLCVFFFWIGTVLVRLWFYKGALGPTPEKYLIIPHHRKTKSQLHHRITQSNKRGTVFPQVAHLADNPKDPFSDAHAIPDSKPYFTTIPAITVNGLDVENDYDDTFTTDLEDPARIQRYIAEECRISRLPAFDQDDCGDGTDFPEVPYATNPIEPQPSRGLEGTSTYLQLGLQKVNNMSQWLKIDNTYVELHEARASLLDCKASACVQVGRDGEAACEELLDVVVRHLCRHFPDRFSITMKHRRSHVRNELTGQEYALVKPFECHPLEICARLAIEDFSVWVQDEFTLQWYLQASATLFPSGHTIAKYIGKSLSAIINDPNDPMPLWQATLHTQTSTFIQTRPASSPLSTSLHLPRPADLFPGSIAHLSPPSLWIRRLHTSFRRLPVSGAIVTTTRTQLSRLVDVDTQQRRKELWAEVSSWGEEEAVFKGRDLWIRAVRSWCVGGEAWCDDRTVVGGGGGDDGKVCGV